VPQHREWVSGKHLTVKEMLMIKKVKINRPTSTSIWMSADPTMCLWSMLCYPPWHNSKSHPPKLSLETINILALLNSILKMMAAGSSKTLVTTYMTAQCHNPEYIYEVYTQCKIPTVPMRHIFSTKIITVHSHFHRKVGLFLSDTRQNSICISV
jgi:hypothetical protein